MKASVFVCNFNPKGYFCDVTNQRKGMFSKTKKTCKRSRYSCGPWQITLFGETVWYFAEVSKTRLVVLSGLTLEKCFTSCRGLIPRYWDFSDVTLWVVFLNSLSRLCRCQVSSEAYALSLQVVEVPIRSCRVARKCSFPLDDDLKPFFREL